VYGVEKERVPESVALAYCSDVAPVITTRSLSLSVPVYESVYVCLIVCCYFWCCWSTVE